jgi:ABC-type nitrate/sulfonate/bicarbonate transport system ATPase subunit
MLELTDCTAGYGARDALSGVTLSADPGRVSCIVGPSGCGKTTLLMLAAGLKRPSRGTVLLDGREVSPGDRSVGLILQHFGLFPWFTVQANVELGLRIRGAPAEERRAGAAREIEASGLRGLESRFPRELSGGQQQRVAIARAYALRPRLLLMDEPFSSLDALNREALQDLLLASARERGTAVLMVTHSIEEAAYLGSVVWVMAGSPGRISGKVQNPSQGRPGYRQDPEFLSTCGKVRALMEQGAAR